MSLLYEGFLSNPRTHYGPNLEVEVTVTASNPPKEKGLTGLLVKNISLFNVFSVTFF